MVVKEFCVGTAGDDFYRYVFQAGKSVYYVATCVGEAYGVVGLCEEKPFLALEILVNGVVNLFVMILSGIMPVSIMFPMVSAGGIIVTYLVSRFYYKEKLTKMQFAGFLTGLASIVFLNI